MYAAIIINNIRCQSISHPFASSKSGLPALAAVRLYRLLIPRHQATMQGLLSRSTEAEFTVHSSN